MQKYVYESTFMKFCFINGQNEMLLDVISSIALVNNFVYTLQ